MPENDMALKKKLESYAESAGLISKELMVGAENRGMLRMLQTTLCQS